MDLFLLFTYRSLISYSDGCSGQNKNHTIISLLADLQRQGVYEVINHKFLVRGHTFLENDRDFSQIEKRKKNPQALVPDDWQKVVREANLRKPFVVCRILFIYNNESNRKTRNDNRTASD